MITGNTAFFGTNEYVLALSVPSNDPSAYVYYLANLDLTNPRLIPPSIPTDSGFCWAYSPSNCVWWLVSSAMYSQITQMGKVGLIQDSSPVPIQFSFRQDTMLSEKSSNHGLVGNIEVFPYKMGLASKNLTDLQKSDGSKYTETDAANYVPVVSLTDKAWKVLPRNGLISEAFIDIDGSTRWRPQTIDRLLQFDQITQVVTTGEVAYVDNFTWKYGVNNFAKTVPSDFAAHLSNYNIFDTRLQPPDANHWAYHIAHGVWYKVDSNSKVAIQKAGVSGEITYLGSGSLVFGVHITPAIEHPLDTINAGTGHHYTIDDARNLLMTLVDNRLEACTTDQLVWYMERPRLLGELWKIKTTSSAPIKCTGKAAFIANQGDSHTIIYGECEHNGYKCCDFASNLIGAPVTLDVNWAYHIEYNIWLEVDSESYNLILRQNQVASYQEHFCNLPVKQLYFRNEYSGDNLNLYTAKTVDNNIVTNHLSLKKDFVISVLNLDIDGSVKYVPTTPERLLATRNVKQVVNHTARIALVEYFTGHWILGTNSLNAQNGLPQAFAAIITNYHQSDTRFRKPNIKTQTGYVWAYHINHKVWYEVSIDSWADIKDQRKLTEIHFSSTGLPVYPDYNPLAPNSPATKDPQTIGIYHQGKWSLVGIKSLIIVGDVDNRNKNIWRVTTVGMLCIDYDTSASNIILTRRATYDGTIGISDASRASYTKLGRYPSRAPASGCCWLFEGLIWRECLRASYFQRAAEVLDAKFPLVNRTDLDTGSVIEGGNLELVQSRILSKNSTNTEPIQACIKSANHSNLVRCQLYNNSGNSLANLLPDTFILCFKSGIRHILRAKDVVGQMTGHVSYKNEAVFFDGTWNFGVAEPHPSSPCAFVSAFRAPAPEPDLVPDLGYSWAYHSFQHLWYQVRNDSYWQIKRYGCVGNIQSSFRNLPEGLPVITEEIGVEPTVVTKEDETGFHLEVLCPKAEGKSTKVNKFLWATTIVSSIISITCVILSIIQVPVD